jgi:hypothetical protein
LTSSPSARLLMLFSPCSPSAAFSWGPRLRNWTSANYTGELPIMSCLEPQFDCVSVFTVAISPPIRRWQWYNDPLSVCSHHSATLKWTVVSHWLLWTILRVVAVDSVLKQA